MKWPASVPVVVRSVQCQPERPARILHDLAADQTGRIDDIDLCRFVGIEDRRVESSQLGAPPPHGLRHMVDGDEGDESLRRLSRPTNSRDQTSSASFRK